MAIVVKETVRERNLEHFRHLDMRTRVRILHSCPLQTTVGHGTLRLW